MAIKKSTKTAKDKGQKNLPAVTITPSSMLGELLQASEETGNDYIVKADPSLPEIFQNARVVDINFAPMPEWDKPGQYAYGIYNNKRVGVGPNESNVYDFKAPLKNGKSFAWSTWGNWSIDYVMKSAQIGDLVCLMYMGEKEIGRKDPMKVFKGQVVDKEFYLSNAAKILGKVQP